MTENDIKYFWEGYYTNLPYIEWTYDVIKNAIGTDDEERIGDYRSDRNEVYEHLEHEVTKIFSSKKALEFAKFTVPKNKKLQTQTLG